MIYPLPSLPECGDGELLPLVPPVVPQQAEAESHDYEQELCS